MPSMLYAACDAEATPSQEATPAESLFDQADDGKPSSPATSAAGSPPPDKRDEVADPSAETAGAGAEEATNESVEEHLADRAEEVDSLPLAVKSSNRFAPLAIDALDNDDDDGFVLPFQLPRLSNEDDGGDEQEAPRSKHRIAVPTPAKSPPPRPVSQSKKRRNAAAFRALEDAEEQTPSITSTIEKAKVGSLFKHRARAKGPVSFADVVVTVDNGAKCNVVDSHWFASWAPTLELELEPAPESAGVRLANNALQRLVGFTTIRVQVGLTEELVRFRVLNAGQAFQLLLGKPWKAQIGSIHFYAIDCILDLARNPASNAVHPAVLLTLNAAGHHGPRSALKLACLTPIPEDNGLISLDDRRNFHLPFSRTSSATSHPAKIAAALRKEAWRRKLTLHPRADLLPDAPGSTFLDQREIDRIIRRLERNNAACEFWRAAEGAASGGKWERWASPSLPALDPSWLEPDLTDKAQLPTMHAVMIDTLASEPSLEERRAEVRGVVQVGDDGHSFSPSEKEQIYSLVDEFTDQFAFSLSEVQATDTVHMRIPMPGAVPTRARHHPTNNPDQKVFLYKQIDKLLEAGVIVKSIAESEAKMHGWVEQKLNEFPVEAAKPKKWRLCHAFLDLNDATVGASWPTGDLNAKIGNLSGKKYYSCFDMHSGYFAIEIEPEDVLKTTFAVEDRGYYAYKRMPFGLKGAPAAFCELVSTAFRGELGKSMEAWMDDLATSANSFEEHLANIRRILEICRAHKLLLNLAKCQLFASSLVWCGLHVLKEGVQPDKAKVQTVVEWPEPQNPHEVLRFISFASHYRKLIKNFAQQTAAMQSLVATVKAPQRARGPRGSRRRGAYKELLMERPADWSWEKKHQDEFDDIRKALTSFPVIRAPDWLLPFIIETDASRIGLGAVLLQRFRYEHPKSGEIVQRVHPIKFASKGTKPSEKRYSAFLLELVAVKWALEKFKAYIFGRPIEPISDCQALAGILSLQNVSPSHARWREYILGHDIIKFVHQEGKLNAAADELSRRANLKEGDEVTPESTIPLLWTDYVDERDAAEQASKSKDDSELPSQEQSAASRAPTKPQPQKVDPGAEPQGRLEKARSDPFLEEAAPSPSDDGPKSREQRAATEGRQPNPSSHQGKVDPCVARKGRFEKVGSGLEPLEAAFSAFFIESNDKEVALRARFKGDEFFEPIVEFLLTLQPPDGATPPEAGRLRRSAWSYFIGDGGSLRRVCNDKPSGRECIPERERRALVLSTHKQLAHGGRDRCQQFGRQVFRTKLQPISVLAPMQLLSMDYFSLPRIGARGYKSVLVIVDYFSRFTWAYKFKEDTGRTTVSALTDLFDRFGCPSVLLSDNGSHLNCKEVNTFCEERGVERRTTPTYLPNTNGLVERTNSLLLSALERACAPANADGPTQKWPDKLHSVVDQLNNRVVSTTGSRPSDLIFGYEHFPKLHQLPADNLLAEAFDTILD
ncbi:hypothetical protein JCM9279_001790 [Rhodotorula babjevae]